MSCYISLSEHEISGYCLLHSFGPVVKARESFRSEADTARAKYL